MTHIDEHRLELFVLDPDGLGEAAGEIRLHLRECTGCALLVEQIRAFYVRAEENLDQEMPAQRAGSQSVMVRDDQALDLFAPVGRVPAHYRFQRRAVIGSFVARHPVVSGSGAFALVAASLAAVLFLGRGPSDTNPAYTHLNPEQGMLEVFNGHDQRLWSLPVQEVEATLERERTMEIATVQVADLDGDGTNEVISIQKLSRDGISKPPSLRVFDHAGNERFSLKFGSAISFGNAEYDENYRPVVVAISSPDTPGGSREIIVVACNLRSPSVITRVSSTGEVMGEYWHFGSLYGLSTLTLQEKPSILAWGTNDLPDASGPSDKSFGMIVLLDQASLVGRCQSTCTPHFGLPASLAERRYIALPRGDIEETLGLPAATKRLFIERDSILTFICAADGPQGKITFFYSFTRDLTPLRVRSDEVTELEHRRLASKGKVISPWNQTYLDDLQARIRFLR